MPGVRQGLSANPTASGCPFPRPRPPQLGGGVNSPGQSALVGPPLRTDASRSLRSTGPPRLDRVRCWGAPESLPLPLSVAPRLPVPSRGWGRSEPLLGQPHPVWGVGPETTVAGVSDNETHGVAIPARSGAHPLSPPHRATQRLSLLGDPSTHPTGGQGHRGAGRQVSGQAGSAQTMSPTHHGRERKRGGRGGY